MVLFSTGSSVDFEERHPLCIRPTSVWEMPAPASVRWGQIVVFLHQPGDSPVTTTHPWAPSSVQAAGHRAVPPLSGWYGIHRLPGRADIRCHLQTQRNKCFQTHSVHSHSYVRLGPQSFQCAENSGEMPWTLHYQRIAASAAHRKHAETRFSWRWDHDFFLS